MGLGWKTVWDCIVCVGLYVLDQISPIRLFEPFFHDFLKYSFHGLAKLGPKQGLKEAELEFIGNEE